MKTRIAKPLGSPERAEYALQLAENGISGKVTIPRDAATCKKALNEYRAHIAEHDRLFGEHAASFTADEQMQERVIKELWRRAQKRE